MAGSAKRGRDWVFTENNYPGLLDCETIPDARYVVYQEEVGENGTPHLQGFIQFMSARTLGQVTAALPGAHVEPRRGTLEQAIDYSKKVGVPGGRRRRPRPRSGPARRAAGPPQAGPV